MNPEREFARYWERVLGGEYPSDPRVPLPAPYVGAAGLIQNLMLQPGAACISIIESPARAVRSNHYHRLDWHFLYVVSGCMLYYEREVGQGGIPEPALFGARQMVFTRPMLEHATAFPEATVLLSISRRPRDQAAHESDVVRVEFLKPEALGW